MASEKYLPVYRELLRAHGPQGWWPGHSHFEIMAGALLTQNTNWGNASRAIESLRGMDMLDAHRILETDVATLERCIRPSGCFRIKAKRLRNLCHWLVQSGGVNALAGWKTVRLREQLLNVSGIGPETADAILLYALARPVFVVDAYAFRFFTRLGLIPDREQRPAYEELRRMVEEEVGAEERVLNEFHALIVRHGKHPCRAKPVCVECTLLRQCAFARDRFIS